MGVGIEPRDKQPHKDLQIRVEQIVTTVYLGLRRQDMQLQYVTEGNVPCRARRL